MTEYTEAKDRFVMEQVRLEARLGHDPGDNRGHLARAVLAEAIEREKQPRGREKREGDEPGFVCQGCGQIYVCACQSPKPTPPRETAEGLLAAIRYDLDAAHYDEPTDGRGFTVAIAKRCFERLDRALALIRADAAHCISLQERLDEYIVWRTGAEKQHQELTTRVERAIAVLRKADDDGIRHSSSNWALGIRSAIAILEGREP